MRTAVAIVALTLGAACLAPSAAAQKPTTATTPGCVVGAQLEGLRGKSWYDVTVKKGPARNGRCFVAFDDDDAGFPDGYVTALRPRGGGAAATPVAPATLVAPAAPAARTVPAASAPTSVRPTPSAATGAAVRDGVYSCGKIVGGGGEFRNFGEFTIRKGQLANSPLPDGWSVESITNGPRNPRGVPLVLIRYRTSSGNTDLLDCEPA